MKRKLSDGGIFLINRVEVGTFSDLYFEEKKDIVKHDDKIDALSYTVID